jgi:hypothetical protein
MVELHESAALELALPNTPLMAFVISVIGDVPVDREALVVTTSILRICRLSL